MFVFLILAALYESWSLPFSVLLTTPVAVLGAFLALAAASNNPHVGAVVEQDGGLWNGKESRVRHLPATLVRSGPMAPPSLPK